MWMDIAQQEADQEARSDEEDTVYDRTNPFRKTSLSEPLELRVMLDDHDTRCGIGECWRPDYLQRFANKTFFSIMFTVTGVIHGAFWSYYSANISTFEKRFRIDSTTSGVALFANELAQLLIAIVFTYFGFKQHRAKLLALGLALSALSCFLMASPHYFLGSGEMALTLVKRDFSNERIIPEAMPLVDSGLIQDSPIDTTEPSSVAFLPSGIPADEVVKAALAQQALLTSNGTVSTEPPGSPEAPPEQETPPVTVVTVVTGADKNVTNNETTTSHPETPSTSETQDSKPPEVPTSPEVHTTTDHPETTVEETTPESQFPYLNDQMRNVWPMCNRYTEEIDEHSKEVEECNTKEYERKFAFSFLLFANFLSGLGSMLFLLSGGPFTEDSTILPNELPRIFGITLALRLIGPFFGYMFAWTCLSEFVKPTATVVQYDSRWMGAWWLGWTFLGIFMAIMAFIFSLFPRQSPREFLKKRSLTHETGLTMYLIPNIVPFFGGAELKTANPFPSIVHIASVVQGFLRNQVYFILTFSNLLHIFVGVGYLTFLPKYLEFMFRLKAGDSAMLTGLASVPFQVAGLMLGGAFISRYLPSSKEISCWNVIVTVIQVIGLIVICFVGCSTDNIDVSFKYSLVHHTPEVADHPGSTTMPTTTLRAGVVDPQHCSADCDCRLSPILPVCDESTGATYYSPCFAGCEKVVNQSFSECSCLPFDNITLTEGYCAVDTCSAGLIAFMVLLCATQFLNSSGVVGRMLMSFKSIQADQRTAIIGFTLFLASVIAVIPSPIVYGSLFESACLIREESCNNEEVGNCWLYDNTTLRFAYNLSTAAFMVLALVSDVVLWRSQKQREVRIYDGELSQSPGPSLEISRSNSHSSHSDPVRLQ